jgi:hypothetical protein
VFIVERRRHGRNIADVRCDLPGRAGCRPRLSSVSSNPRSSASWAQAELMVPVPPIKRIFMVRKFRIVLCHEVNAERFEMPIKIDRPPLVFQAGMCRSLASLRRPWLNWPRIK